MKRLPKLYKCPERYKATVINAYLNRAYNLSLNWELFHLEVQKIKQVLTNNNYPLQLAEHLTEKFLNKKLTKMKLCKNSPQPLILCYRNQMSTTGTKDEFCATGTKDEKVLKGSFKLKVTCVIEENRLQLRIYYKCKRVANVRMNNNISAKNCVLSKANVVHKIKCPMEACKLPSIFYIGNAQCTLSQRITMHMQNGSFRYHIINTILQRHHNTDNMEILQHFSDNNTLFTYEALAIKYLKPSINLKRYCRLYYSQASNEVEHANDREIILKPLALSDSIVVEHNYNTRYS